MELDLVDGVGGGTWIELESTNIAGSVGVTFAVELAGGAIGVDGAARSAVAGGTFS